MSLWTIYQPMNFKIIEDTETVFKYLQLLVTYEIEKWTLLMQMLKSIIACCLKNLFRFLFILNFPD